MNEIRELLREARRSIASDHPATPEWLDYHAGRLNEQSAERLAEHLLDCAECREFLLALAETPEGFEPLIADVPLDATDSHEIWRGLAQRLGFTEARPKSQASESIVTREAKPTAQRASRSERRIPKWVPYAWSASLAAMLGIAVGLGVYVASLRKTLAALEAPRANSQVVDLTASPLRGDTSAAAQRLELFPAGATLVLAVPLFALHFSSYTLEIVEEPETVRWRAYGVTPDPYGSFTIALSPRSLPRGFYRVRLLGMVGETPEVAFESRLEIVEGTERSVPAAR